MPAWKFNKYLENPTVRITLFVGGYDEKEQYRALEEGVDITVGTLQKSMDYVRKGSTRKKYSRTI